MESLIRVFDFTNNRIYANLFCNSDKFFNMVKSDFEKYLSCSSKSQSKLTLHSRFDSSEKPQNLICDVCLGKGYNIV
jgi:hypothetical protein